MSASSTYVVISRRLRTCAFAVAGSVTLVACGSTNDSTLPELLSEQSQALAAGPPQAQVARPTATAVAFRVVAEGLAFPYEITWGPDQQLWITERVGKRVVRLNPVDGTQKTAIEIAEVFQTAGQDGLLGMALHPELLLGTGNDYVYIAYTYDADGGPEEVRRTKLRRYVYDATSETLGSPVDLITGLSGSNDHNSGRLVFGPDGKLYYTIGDQGANQFDNKCNPIRAQELPSAAEVAAHDWSKYVGKILRLNLDGSIPGDNPPLRGVRSHIFSYGHRNPQGLVFGFGRNLYSSEHGPKTDDELNLILAGGNYGWPHVAGYRDDKAYVYGNWSQSVDPPCEELEFSDYVIPGSVPQAQETDWYHPRFVPPLETFYTVETGYDFQDPACAGNEYICWPTIAPSSLDFYSGRGPRIPGWSASLLVPSLKEGTIFRAELGPLGASIRGEPTRHFKTTNRYRDIAQSPDRRAFYIITDNEGNTQSPSGGYTSDLENRGAVLEFKYTGRLIP